MFSIFKKLFGKKPVEPTETPVVSIVVNDTVIDVPAPAKVPKKVKAVKERKVREKKVREKPAPKAKKVTEKPAPKKRGRPATKK